LAAGAATPSAIAQVAAVRIHLRMIELPIVNCQTPDADRRRGEPFGRHKAPSQLNAG
jgi:hypothetical protein